MTETVAPVLPGETMAGKYRVERLLGRGGMGVVVLARHLDLDERFAIKFLVGDPSEQAVERFTREARAAAKVKGEHVCRVFDFGRLETGEPYIVMEYLEGIDLADKLAEEGPQPVERVAGWLVEICDALSAAHALGIVHRDLKPANVFLTKRGDGSTYAKVLDFGISKLPMQSQMTATSATMGSPAYMSPEQMASARDVDVRADVYSLGVLAYEMLTGKPPFIAETMVELVVKVREQAPPPLTGVPDEIARVVAKCLAKKPEDRHASVAELCAVLRPFVPTELAALAARLADAKARGKANAQTSSNSGALALDKTVPADEGRTRTSDPTGGARQDAVSVPDSSAEAQALARARGTFAPLQSTMDGSVAKDRPSAKRWSTVAAVVALLIVGGVAGRSFLMHPGKDDVVADAAMVPAVPSPSAIATGEALPDGAKSVITQPPSTPDTSSSAPPSARPAISAVATGTAVAPKTMARADAGAPAPVVSTSATSATAAPPPSPPVSAAKPPRRPLDRDDP